MKSADAAHPGDGNALVPQRLLFPIGQPADIPVERGVEVEGLLIGSRTRARSRGGHCVKRTRSKA